MEAQGEKDSARIMQKNMEEKFSGGVYDELDKIIGDINKNDIDIAKGT